MWKIYCKFKFVHIANMVNAKFALAVGKCGIYHFYYRCKLEFAIYLLHWQIWVNPTSRAVVETRIYTLSLQLLEKYLLLYFMIFCIIKKRCKECQIFLQRLKTRSMTTVMTSQPNLNPFFLLRGHFETGSKISPVWTLTAPRRKVQIKNFFAMYIRTLSRF